ncbi:MAG: bifunctional nuclease family protein [Candidatus Latescibacterota bacterium]|nr:MAG: bifunctional nuclease family protein [Candidatus Latescibacterota bacterium]
MKNGDKNFLRVEVGGLIKDNKENPIVLLKGAENEEVLPIWIGHAEALSIDLQLQGKTFDRPLTHDLLKTAVESLGATVAKVAVTELRDNIFYAKIYIQRGTEVYAIDARPSDSIALAIRTQSPIYVSESVFETHKHAVEEKHDDSDEELRKYLRDLDPGDF